MTISGYLREILKNQNKCTVFLIIAEQIRDSTQWTGEPLCLTDHNSFVSLPNPFLIPFILLVSKTSWCEEVNLHSANLLLFSDSKIWRYPLLSKALYASNLVDVPILNPISSSEKPDNIPKTFTLEKVSVRTEETGNFKRTPCFPFVLWLDHPPHSYICGSIKMKSTNCTADLMSLWTWGFYPV